nr:hypothetical protein GCM10010200_036730 [Actinomadura rugatobispora]
MIAGAVTKWFVTGGGLGGGFPRSGLCHGPVTKAVTSRDEGSVTTVTNRRDELPAPAWDPPIKIVNALARNSTRSRTRVRARVRPPKRGAAMTPQILPRPAGGGR